MLPSRRDLASEYDVSSVTIGRAMDRLIAEGLLQADSRRGTFVAFSTALLSAGGELSAVIPDALNRTERSRPTQTIGIVAPLDDAQSRRILHSLEHDLSESGYVTSVYDRVQPREETLLPLEAAIEALLREGVDALVVIGLDLDRVRVEEALNRVDLQDTPTVCILAGELHLPIPHVFYDNRIGGYQAAKHLIGKGHRKITVFAPFTASWVTERIAGIRHALAYAGRPAEALEIVPGDGLPWDFRSDPTEIGMQTAQAALESGWQAQGGVICINDQVAHGVCHVALEYGFQAGTDYAVVGFDDEKCARVAGITTLRPPLEAMGREAARLLAAEMQGSHAGLQVRLRAHLIARASTNFTPAAALETVC